MGRQAGCSLSALLRTARICFLWNAGSAFEGEKVSGRDDSGTSQVSQSLSPPGLWIKPAQVDGVCLLCNYMWLACAD